MSITKINSECVKFAYSLINKNFTLDILRHVADYMTVKNVNCKLLETLCDFLDIEGQYLYVNPVLGTNEIRTMSYGELLMQMHYYNPYIDVDKESLLTHSILTMFKVGNILPEDMPNRHKLHMMIFSLFHDIGKINCKEIKNKYVSFPFHGEISETIMLQMYTYNSFVSKNEWENLCRGISIHENGSHSLDYGCKDTQYKMNMFSYELPQTLRFVSFLMYGNLMGHISNTLHKDSYVLHKRSQFIKHVSKVKTFEKFFIKENIKGILIKLCGIANSGKTIFANDLISFLQTFGISKTDIVLIERDVVLSNVCLHMIDPETEPFTEKPDPVTFKRLHDIYIAQKLRHIVNKKITDIIEKNVNKIVIFDSIGNLYSANYKIPSSVSQMLRININITRSIPMDTNDIDLKKLKNYGFRDVLNVYKNSTNFTDLSVISSKDKIIPCRVKPHFNFQIVWNDSICMGTRLLHIMLEKIIPVFLHKPKIN